MRVTTPDQRGQYHSLVMVLVHKESGEAAAQPMTLHYTEHTSTEGAESDAIDYYVSHPELVPDGFTLTGAYVTHTWEVK